VEEGHLGRRARGRLELDGLASEEDDETTLHELIADESQTMAPDAMERKELLALMAARIQQLPDMQKKVLALYYFEEMRLAEIRHRDTVRLPTMERISNCWRQPFRSMASH
jgi:DNA-directed RNA polymerase specialized sigma subunit